MNSTYFKFVQDGQIVNFNVTRRSRSDVGESVSESGYQLRADLTDVTLVSDDTFISLY